MRLLRGLVAQLLIVAMMIAVPIALAVTVGNPLRSWGDLRAGDISSTALVDLLAGIAYLAIYVAWAQFAVATLVEAIAAAAQLLRRGPSGVTERSPIRVPGVFAGQQRLAHALISAAFLLTPTASLATPAHALSLSAVPAPPAGAAISETAAPASAPNPTPPTWTYTVPDGGGPATLWDLATTYLGSGQRWTDIWQLNAGRIQADGTTMTNPGLLRPDWTVLIPGAAPESSPGERPPPGWHAQVVRRGDSLAALAEPDGVRNWRTVWPRNQGRAEPDGERFTQPWLVRPGWTVLLPNPAATPTHSALPNGSPPGSPRPPHRPIQPPDRPPTRETPPSTSPGRPTSSASTSPANTPPRTAPSAGATPARSAAPAASSSGPAGGHGDDLAVVVLATLGSSTLLGGVAMAALQRRRRRQWRHRNPGRMIATTPPALTRVEKNVRLAADHRGRTDIARLDQALRELVRAQADRPDSALPDVQAALLANDHLELILASPNLKPPPPWTIDDTGVRWHLQRDDQPAATPLSADEHWAPFPALTSVGVTDTGATCLLDLERTGVLHLTGDGTGCANLARFMAAELSHNSWSDQLRVSLTGLGNELKMLNHDRLHCAADSAAAITELRAQLADLAAAAGPTNADVLTARLRNFDAETFTPYIAIIAQDHEHPDPALADLAAALAGARGRTPVALVLVEATRPGTRSMSTGAHVRNGMRILVDADGTLTIPDLSLDLTAHQLPVDEAADLAVLLDLAADVTDRPMPPARGSHNWAQHADVAGAPRAPTTTAASRVAVLDPRPATESESTLQEDAPSTSHTESPGPAALIQSAATSPADAEAPASAELQHTATTAADLTLLTPPLPEATRHAIRSADPDLDADLAAWHDPDSPIPKLHLLGPPHLTGLGPAPGSRGALLVEIVTYLLTRPHGATLEQFATDVWPHIPDVATKTTPRQSVSMARQWLGRTARGTERLPRAVADTAGAKVYLVEDVLVDADLFRRLRLRGTARGAEGIEDLRAALALVSGAPFTQLRPGGYSWLTDTPLDHEYTAMIIDVAHMVATHDLQAGDPDAAAAAAQIALLAGAVDDVALLDLMAACQARGDHAEAELYVRRILTNHDAAVEEDLPPRTYEVLLRLGWITR